MNIADFLISLEDEQESIDPIWVGQQLYEQSIYYFSLWTYWLECHPEFDINLSVAEYYWRKVFY